MKQDLPKVMHGCVPVLMSSDIVREEAERRVVHLIGDPCDPFFFGRPHQYDPFSLKNLSRTAGFVHDVK